MNCREATTSYEDWLRQRTRVIEADVALKHEKMAAGTFPFMRATFYRWIELWREQCPDLAKAPVVLAVGDLHVENFGTWRDAEGRMVWGVNDFDEAFELPYTNDLVRLAVSACLAISEHDLALGPRAACRAILDGYQKGLEEDSQPFVLAERHAWLRTAVTGRLRSPAKFWDKLNNLPEIKSRVPRKATKALNSAMPARDLTYRVVHRVAGLGSLGRQRFVAIAPWNGGLIAREAKAMVPSACVWLNRAEDDRSRYQAIVSQAIRCPDPFLTLRKNWIVRRLSSYCSRVELATLAKERDEDKLLVAMGRETANIHRGSRHAVKKIKLDLRKRADDWLHAGAKRMVRATTEDWQDWQRAQARSR